MTVHKGVWRPDDRAAACYRYLPVSVPVSGAGLTVELDYDRSGGAVLDLGCAGPAGFRGWSGGARSRYAITPTAATPGYLPGELEPGEWHAVLGLHRVPPDGVAYEVTATVGPTTVETEPAAPPVPDRPPRRELPAPDGLTWLAGDLHAHTVHSDGVLGIEGLAGLAAGAGLDFLAVTDHNTVSHHPLLAAAGRAAGVLLVPGQEVTTDRGHANAFGDIGWVDFREPATRWVASVAARGGLLSVNHPLGADCAWRHPLGDRPPLAEVWHSGWWDRRWGAPLAWWQAFGLDTVAVGGSDFHDSALGHTLGTPTTWVACAGEETGAVLDGLAAGRVAVSAAADGPLLLRVANELHALEAEGLLLTDLSGRRTVVRADRAVFPAPDGPAWLEDHETQVHALAGSPPPASSGN